MEDETGEGRTVLFVSHNMSAVETLCNRVIEIRTGNLYSDGNNVLELIGDYLTSGISGDSNNENCQWINKEDDLFLNEYHTFHKISLVDERENVFKGIIPASAPIYLNISMSIKRHDPSLNIGYAIYKNGEPLYWSWMKDEQGDFTDLKENISVTLQTVIPPHFLSRGEYVIEIFSVLDKIKILVKKGEGVRIPFEIEGSFAEVRLHPKFEWLIKEK
jgi:lipopolysaccharide transport system ATP-binding protein